MTIDYLTYEDSEERSSLACVHSPEIPITREPVYTAIPGFFQPRPVGLSALIYTHSSFLARYNNYDDS